MKKKGIRLTIFFICFFVSTSVFAQEKIIASVTVESGDYQRYDTPVFISLDDLEIKENIKLIEIKGDAKEQIPAQINKSENRLYWILSGRTEKEASRTFELWSTAVGESNDVVAVSDGEGITLKWKNKQLLKYHSVAVELPQGVDSAYTRGAFIHPLNTLLGRTLTRIHPEDHYHHVGIWNPWTKTTFQGREIDFWNLAKKQGTVRFKSIESTQSGNVFGGFSVRQEHIDLTAPGGETVAMDEKWEVKLYQAGDNPYYIVDFTSVLECATDSSITLNQYRYGGGIGFRATELWSKENCDVLTSEGKTRLDGDATHAKWCNVFGRIDTSTSGVLFLCNPDNFEFPQAMRIWPINANDDNGDMYFQFCPIRHKHWHLETEKKYFQQYRMVVYDGKMPPEQAEQLWLDYANPPKIFIQKEK